MKTLFTVLSASVVLGLTAVAEPTNNQSQGPLQLARRIFKIAPDAFFISVKHRIAPKHGENDEQILVRFFKEQRIDLESHKAVVVLDEKRGMLIIRAPAEDLDRVEALIAKIEGEIKEHQDKFKRHLPEIADVL
jgi:type II secretory pathway component HofQ